MSFAGKLANTRMFKDINRWEDELFTNPDGLHPTSESPIRFEIIKETLKRGEGGPPKRMIPIMIPTLFGIRKTLQSLKDNPAPPRKNAEADLFPEIESYALKLGASSIGYTQIPKRWVFQGKSILYENAIVLTMEMNKDDIDSAPCIECMRTVMETYRDLGRITNKISEMLRRRGFGAHAAHPLMGPALYPPLAQMAGLGWIGLNGIIITPEHGPRVRLAAVFTSIENLPFSDRNEHAWVVDYCNRCKACIKKCPPQALYESPFDHGNGQVTYVENDLCFPYFSDNYGCSVCISVCTFNHAAYTKLKEKLSNGSVG